MRKSKRPSYKKFVTMLDELMFNVHDLYHEYEKKVIDAEECIELLSSMFKRNAGYLKSKYNYKVS